MASEKHDQRQWFLRTGDKTVFGPVPTHGLIVWAEQGRILSGHEISSDRKIWTPAEQIPELNITWYVDDGTGNLRGPLNRIAAEQILKSDKAPAGARLIEAKNADLTRVMRPTEPVPMSEPTPTASRKDTSARAHGEGPATDASPSPRLIEERDARIARLKQTVERLERELADARNLPLLGVTPETPTPVSASSAKEKAALTALMAQLADRDQEIARLKNAEAELLAFANTRDAELRSRVTDLEAQLAAVPRTVISEITSRTPEHDDLLHRIVNEEIETLDKDLVRERESFTVFRNLSARRQEALQARMQELTRLLRGDSTMPGSRIVHDHTRTFETNRLQAELEALRTALERATSQTEEREAELLRRARELGIEQKHRLAEREQYQTTEQALLRRIEELERNGGVPAASGITAADEPPPQDNRIFRVMPWMRLRR